MLATAVQEVRILKGIRHPNVLFFRGLCLQPPMIITELCDHGSVSDVIDLTNRMNKPNGFVVISDEKRAMYNEHMSWGGRVKLALDAAKGMLYLHTKDLLHCDLKSLNLLVDRAWTCKVADFGLSRCARRWRCESCHLWPRAAPTHHATRCCVVRHACQRREASCTVRSLD
jgi:serine/threonine protein kinase